MARANITGARATAAKKRATLPEASARKTGRTSQPEQIAPRGRGTAGPAPKVSKDELRAQVEKLARVNANLRAKNKELKRAASEATDRIAHLEGKLSRQERHAAKPDASRAGRKPRRQPAIETPDHDPGDAVPPGVAVQEPQPLGEADQAVLDHLNEELAPE